MKRILTIALCIMLSVIAVSAFGQKQVKKPKQVNSVSQISQSQFVKPSSSNNNSNVEACWKITGKNGDIEFRWDTEAKVTQWINEMQSQHNEIYSYERCNHQTIEACDANNEKVQPKKCWTITGTKNGQSTEMYLWSTETVARRKVASLQGQGYQNAKYVETPANDEKSCNAASSSSSNEPACWMIKIGNTVTYLWGYESEAQTMVNNARNSGQTASYERSVKDKADCIK